MSEDDVFSDQGVPRERCQTCASHFTMGQGAACQHNFQTALKCRQVPRPLIGLLQLMQPNQNSPCCRRWSPSVTCCLSLCEIRGNGTMIRTSSNKMIWNAPYRALPVLLCQDELPMPNAPHYAQHWQFRVTVLPEQIHSKDVNGIIAHHHTVS